MIFILISCEGDMEPVTYDAISPSNFFETRDDVNAAVTGVYAEFGWSFIDRIYNGEIGTDEYRNNWSGEDQLNNFEWTGDGTYSGLYTAKIPAVTRTGALLEELENIGFLDEDEKKRFIAEVKTARAIHMFDLLNSFGPCPVILDEQNLKFPDNNYKPVRPDVNTTEGEEFESEYIAQIEADLTEAIQDLKVDAPNFGRFDKGTAMTVLLKLYMHQKQWAKAETISQQIISLNKYSLVDDYSAIWSIDNEQNDEIIWAIPRTSNTFGQPFRARTLYSPYDITDEDKWNGDKVRFEFYDTFEATDLRREKIVVEFVNSKGETINMREEGTDFHGGFNLKYDKDPDARTNSGIDVIHYRYADIILSRAESLNELNGPNQEAIDLINQVRRRAGIPDLQLNQFTTKEELRDHILAERGWEFYMEGLRREDLIRHGKYISYAQERNATAKEFHKLYPIPKEAYFENPNIQQNPGYDF